METEDDRRLAGRMLLAGWRTGEPAGWVKLFPHGRRTRQGEGGGGGTRMLGKLLANAQKCVFFLHARGGQGGRDERGST